MLCKHCNKEFDPIRKSAQFCSSVCRLKYFRNKKSPESTTERSVSPISKEEIYNRLKKALSIKRRELADNSLNNFSRIYLKGLMPEEPADFHNEMGHLLAQSTINKGVSNIIQSPENIEEGGVQPPTDSYNDGFPPTHFSHKNKQSTTNLTKCQELNRLLFIAPRGFSKSTICSVAFPLWLALYKKKKDIFIVSSTISLGKELLRKIRNELETNQMIIDDFGDMVSDKWTEEQLVLKNGTCIRAKGQGFQIRGFRPDQIVADDLEDDSTIYSKEQREKLSDWFFRTLIPTLKPDQNLVYVGTMLSNFSLMSKLRKKEEFVVRFWTALKDGKSIWESYWSADSLSRIRKEIGEYAFQSEYMNNPISTEEQPVRQEFLDCKVRGSKEVSCLAIDPAISEKTSSDERAFCLFERTDEGFREVFSEKGRWGITEQIERIIGIYERYRPDRVVIESVAFQKLFKDDLLREARKRGLFIPVTEAEIGMGKDKRPKDKFTRLMQVVHLFEQKLVEVKNQDLVQELVAFPQGDSDNMVDACVYSLYWLMKWRSGGFKKSNEPKILPIRTRPGIIVEEVRPGVYMAREGEPKIKRHNFINLDGN